MSKDYLLDESRMKKVATGHGLCVVSDEVTIEGYPVGLMYREKPSKAGDSGWRFFSGCEENAFLNNPKNHSEFDVNVIANYDSRVIVLLDSPIGSVFEKGPDAEAFVAVTDWSPLD
ncbi:DUF2185 domain-containing protein [Deefgea sp. CFH1-16]|uniref:DUF2185 domain-containing protein n=1 Tax=Deefgea sp. CFH1-16 TaxID=2675457 RepID=UPI0015F6FD99|nr:DUF2185 domain-containing protein [Deefgea sp. CFH1-16]MBM5574546.1 DUF2185 domain-containing protein [Deefgea sp. CFH1-16]